MPARPTQSDHLAQRRGFTLVELLIALAITALAGAAIASMLFAARHASASEQTLRTATVQQKVIRHRLDSAIRSALMVLDRGPNHLVLWTAQQRDFDTPNLSELRRIELDTDNDRLVHYRAPSNFSADEDTPYDLETTDFNAVTDALKGTALFPAEPWCTGVTGWTTSLDTPTAQEARLVAYRLDLAAGDITVTAASTAALRRPAALP